MIPKTFAHIAKKALNFTDMVDKLTGIEALGVLKVDVDNLGLIFACGLKRISLSRLATLSRQMNNYFTIYLPYILTVTEKFQDIYTVFAGGDDLFLIGPWNKIIDLALFINSSFNGYTCENSQITISSGISIHKPGEPVLSIGERAEDALKKSKGNERNSITLFDEPVKWKDFVALGDIKTVINTWMDKKFINNAMLFRLNTFSHMAKFERELLKLKEGIEMEDWECLKWRANFKYTIARNVGRNLKGEEKNNAIKEVEKAADWIIEYGGGMKIAVWQIIYDRR